MPRSRRRTPSRSGQTSPQRRKLKLRVLSLLTSWNRYQVGRIILALLVIWLIGAVGLYEIEGPGNPGFVDFKESLWTVWILLFGGMDDSFAPKTVLGRFLAVSCWSRGSGSPVCSRRAWPRSWSNATCGGATCPTSKWTTTWSFATGPRRAGRVREVHSKIIN